MRRVRAVRWFAAIMWAACLALVGGCATETVPAWSIDRHEATVAVEPDGSLVITERFTGRPPVGGSWFERSPETVRADAFELAEVQVDGEVVTPGGAGTPSVSVHEGERLAVRWQFAEAETAEHTLTVRYVVRGGVEVLPARGRVVWPALPAPRTYVVEESRVALILADGSQWLRGTCVPTSGLASHYYVPHTSLRTSPTIALDQPIGSLAAP